MNTILDQGGLVLDRDGTLTDVERETVLFVRAFNTAVADKLRMRPEIFSARADVIYKDTILGEPGRYGFMANDPIMVGEKQVDRLRIMCPAQVDPFQRVRATAQIMLAGTMSPAEISAFLDSAYLSNHTNMVDAPREGLAEFLHEVHGRDLHTRIVTNSGTEHIRHRTKAVLGEGNVTNWWLERIIGSAGKIDPREFPATNDSVEALLAAALWPAGVDEEYRFNGFPRATVIKRPRYLKTLFEFKTAIEKALGHTIPWSRIVVCGDVFEADLALPLTLGCNVGFMVNAHSPRWEVEYVARHPNGQLLERLDQILPFYDEVQASHTA